MIPQLTRALARSDSALAQLHPADVPDPKTHLAVPDIEPDEYVQYRGLHLIDKDVIEEYEFHVPYAEDPSGVITYYTRSVAKASGVDRLSGAFATLAPMVRDYLKERVFEHPVDLDDKVVLRRLAENDAQAACRRRLRRRRSVSSRSSSANPRSPRAPSGSRRHHRSRGRGRRSRASEHVFNLTPVDNTLEARLRRVPRSRDRRGRVGEAHDEQPLRARVHL